MTSISSLKKEHLHYLSESLLMGGNSKRTRTYLFSITYLEFCFKIHWYYFSKALLTSYYLWIANQVLIRQTERTHVFEIKRCFFLATHHPKKLGQGVDLVSFDQDLNLQISSLMLEWEGEGWLQPTEQRKKWLPLEKEFRVALNNCWFVVRSDNL